MAGMKKAEATSAPLPVIRKKETDQMQAAFDYYFNCGNTRSYRKTAEFFKVAVPTIATWARSFDWQGRLKSRNELVGQKLEERSVAIQTELAAEELATLNEWKKRLVTIGNKYLDLASDWYESEKERLRQQ